MTIAILGCGWLGTPLATALIADGHTVHGATTSPDKVGALRAAGIEPFVLTVTPDGIEGERAAAFFQADALVLTLPPGRGQDDVKTRYPAQVAQVSRVADEAGPSALRHVVYTSSTSVYPDRKDAPPVSEGDAGSPSDKRLRPSGRACLAAEEVLREGLHLTTVLRLAGLYGPDRPPGRFLAGKTDLPGGDQPVNLVHRDDAIAGIVRVLADRIPGTYNLCAREHPARRDFYPPAARALGLEPPTFAPSDGAVTGKRVSSARARSLLGLSFRKLAAEGA